MHGCFACIYICVPHICLVWTFREDRKGHWNPWNWSYRWWWATMEALGTESGSSKTASALIPESSLQPRAHLFKKLRRSPQTVTLGSALCVKAQNQTSYVSLHLGVQLCALFTSRLCAWGQEVRRLEQSTYSQFEGAKLTVRGLTRHGHTWDAAP